MLGEVFDLGVLKRDLAVSSRNIQALEKGLSREQGKLEDHQKFLKNGSDFDDDALKRGLVSIETNIRNIKEILDRERKKRDTCMGGIVAAEEILKRHEEAKKRSGNGDGRSG